MVRIHQIKNFFQRLSDQFIERYVALGYKWVTKDYRLMVNQALIGALRRTKSHISPKLLTVLDLRPMEHFVKLRLPFKLNFWLI